MAVRLCHAPALGNRALPQHVWLRSGRDAVARPAARRRCARGSGHRQRGNARGDLCRRGGSEFRVRHPSGEIRWYLATGHTEFDAQAVAIRLSGVFRDVCARKKAEAEAELLADRLLTLQDEERQRIALELHDSTAQHLLAMSLNLANLKPRILAEPQTLLLFEEIGGSLTETTKELRTFTIS